MVSGTPKVPVGSCGRFGEIEETGVASATGVAVGVAVIVEDLANVSATHSSLLSRTRLTLLPQRQALSVWPVILDDVCVRSYPQRYLPRGL